MKLEIIPVKKGYKKISRKNIKLFADKKLIIWTIDLERNYKLIDKVIKIIVD